MSSSLAKALGRTDSSIGACATPPQAFPSDDWRDEVIAAKRLLHSHQSLEDWSSEGFAALPVPFPPTPATTAPPRDPSAGSVDRLVPALFTLVTCALRGWDLADDGALSPRGIQRILHDHPLQCVGSTNDGGPVYLRGKAYIDYMLCCDGDCDDEPIYIFDRHVLRVPPRGGSEGDDGAEKSSEIVEETAEEGQPPAVTAARAAMRAAYGGGQPPMLIGSDDPLEWQRAIFERLPPRLRPALRYLLLAPPRSGTVIHIDPCFTSTWNTVTHGMKRWAVIHPSCPREIAEGATPPEGCEWSLLEWFTIEWPKLQARCAELGYATYDFVQRKGETAYVPPGWWHAVLNLSNSVAVTHNVLHSKTLQGLLDDAIAAGPGQGGGREGGEGDGGEGEGGDALEDDEVIERVAAHLELDLDVRDGLEGVRAWLRDLMEEGAIRTDAPL